MSTLTFPENERATLRMEIFHNLTSTLRTGPPLNAAKCLSGKSVAQVARAVGLPVKYAEQILSLHALFIKSFGTKILAMNEDESVIIDPAILTEFLSKPAVTRLVSDISTVPEASLLYIIKQT